MTHESSEKGWKLPGQLQLVEDIRCSIKHAPFILIMPSILNTPANEIPLHLFHLPISQREILLINVLTDPVLYKRVINSALYHDDPTFSHAITLF